MKQKVALGVGGLLLAVVVFAVLIPSCTRDPKDVLRFMIWGSPDEISVVRGFLDEFRREHPDIAVQVEHAPAFGYQEKLQILFLGGNPPDVM